MKAAELLKLAQAYATARAARLKLNNEMEKLEEAERGAKEALILAFRNGKTKSVGDGLFNYALVTKNEPQVDDWSQLDSYIRQTGELDLLYRRVNTTAVKERWEQGIVVPGVGHFPVDKVSITKAR